MSGYELFIGDAEQVEIDTSLDETNASKAKMPLVMFVDDEPYVLKAMRRFSRNKDWRVLLASSGEEALEVLEGQEVDIVVSDMKMPGMTGDVFLTKVKEKYPDIIRILLTGHADITALENAINNANIYNYIHKPWDDHLLSEVIKGAIRLQNAERERIRLEHLTKKQNRQLGKLALSLDKTVKERTIEIEQALTLLKMTSDQSKQNLHSALSVVTHLLDWTEGRDSDHSRFVSEHSHDVAKKLSLSEEDCELAKMAGMLHDIGMMALPEHIRLKPVYEMSPDEFSSYQQHPILGEMALATSSNLNKVAQIVRKHHERLDGSGFPEKLYAKSIDKVTRIISIVADYHDLYHGFLVKKCSGHADAASYLKKHSGLAYDESIVDVFIEIIGENYGEKIGRRRLLVCEIKPGMVLDEDLNANNNLLLLTKGTIITENIIDRLVAYEKKFRCRFEPMVKG